MPLFRFSSNCKINRFLYISDVNIFFKNYFDTEYFDENMKHFRKYRIRKHVASIIYWYECIKKRYNEFEKRTKTPKHFFRSNIPWRQLTDNNSFLSNNMIPSSKHDFNNRQHFSDLPWKCKSAVVVQEKILIYKLILITNS